MNEELISVVITTYKRSVEIVDRAIRSVVNQTYRPIEIIVVDDSGPDFVGSDQIKTVLQTYPQARYYRNAANIGACASRNRGLEYAKGEYIAFLDDDDEWLPTKLEKQSAVFKKNNSAALVYCGHINKDTESNKEEVAQKQYISGNVLPTLLRKNIVGSTSFPLMKTNVLRELGGFDVLIKSAQDYDMWIRIAAQYPIDYADEPLAIHYMHDGEQITKNPNNKIQGYERLYEKHSAILKQDPVAQYNLVMATVYYYAILGKSRTAYQKWLKAVSLQPFKITANLKELYRAVKYRKK